MGLLCAVSVILLYIPFLRMPLVAAAPFLEYDAMDIPSSSADFCSGRFRPGAYGRLRADTGIHVSSSSGLYGILMHMIATGALVGVSSVIYSRKIRKGIDRGMVLVPCA
jgi:riboflavin transporter FmnP